MQTNSTRARRGETEKHRELKRLCFAWAAEQGYSCQGFEISLPHCGYRADVAAYRAAAETRAVQFEGRTLRQSHAALGTTAVFECKQSRSDFLRDSCRAGKARERLEQLHGRRVTLERLLRVHFPSAANGDSLFAEYETYSLEAIGHRGYSAVLKGIGRLHNGLLRRNKFEKMIRYGCANLFYLVTEEGIIAECEAPLNCGLLVREGSTLRVVRKPVWQESSAGARLAILHRIALSGSRLAAAKLCE